MKNQRFHKSRVALLLILAGIGAACSGPNLTPQPSAVLETHISLETSQTLYAFSPNGRAVIASYSLPAQGQVAPLSVIAGSNTHLITGNYPGAIAIEGSRLYVLDGVHSQLLTFAKDANGDATPLSVATLPAGSFHGFALDGHGNFWTAEWNSTTMLRFPLNGNGRLKQSAEIVPTLDTPVGFLKAAPVTVATRGSDVYCLCAALHGGAQAIGVSEYHLFLSGHHRLVKSYYDDLGPPLPELPPSMMHVDQRSGDVYAAGLLSYYGLFAWAGTQKSGAVRKRRTILGPATKLENIESLTTDAQGHLYVATPYGIEVFGAKANGNVAPTRQMMDDRHLRYHDEQTGNFLAITRS